MGRGKIPSGAIGFLDLEDSTTGGTSDGNFAAHKVLTLDGSARQGQAYIAGAPSCVALTPPRGLYQKGSKPSLLCETNFY